MERGGQPMDWGAPTPSIQHPTRKSIVDAIRRKGPQSTLELGVLDPDSSSANLSYHAKVLVNEEILREVRRRSVGPSIEITYFFAPSV